MPTLNGPWDGDDNDYRIVCIYSRAYNSDRTAVTFDADFYLESMYPVYDSSNSWSQSGGMGSHSGSGPTINHGSGGGRTRIRSDSVTVSGDISVSFSMTGLEAAAETINATFTLETGGLASTVDDFRAISITSSGWIADITSVSRNGESLSNAAVQVNTSQSASGATYKSMGSYADVPCTGWRRATRYYFRMRIANTSVGWGPWSGWKSVTTLQTIPSTPDSSWSIGNITQTAAEPQNLTPTVADNGGDSIDNWYVQWNTSQSPTGASSDTSGSGNARPQMTNLEPGTLHYARIRAHNSLGWSGYSTWKSFRTLPGVVVWYEGVARNAIPYVRYAGVWRPATRYVRHNSVWR